MLQPEEDSFFVNNYGYYYWNKFSYGGHFYHVGELVVARSKFSRTLVKLVFCVEALAVSRSFRYEILNDTEILYNLYDNSLRYFP